MASADEMTSARRMRAVEVEVEVEVGRGRGPGASSHSQARCGAATLGGRPVLTPSTHSPHSHRTRCNYPIYSDPCNQPVPTRGIRVSRVSCVNAGKLLFMIQSEERTSWSQVLVGGGERHGRSSAVNSTTTLADSLPTDASVGVYC